MMRGIAIGPILFVIAILAVLVSAISSGSGGFSNSERASAAATGLIQMCANYQTAFRKLTVLNECDVTRLDWRPPNFPSGATYTNGDYTGGNGTNRTGTGRCAVYHPMGGGLTYQKSQAEALENTQTGKYSDLGATTANNVDAFAGYPFFFTSRCISDVGTCGSNNNANNAPVVFMVPYVSANVCTAINRIVGNTISINTLVENGGWQRYSPFTDDNIRSVGVSVAPSYFAAQRITQGCGTDHYSNASDRAYVFMCAALIR